jgi:hypothetical protein
MYRSESSCTIPRRDGATNGSTIADRGIVALAEQLLPDDPILRSQVNVRKFVARIVQELKSTRVNKSFFDFLSAAVALRRRVLEEI